MSVLTEIKNRGVADVFFVVCDGLKGLPESANTVFKHANVQACVTHPIRAALRYASRKYWYQLARDMKAIYTANANAAWAAFQREEKWGKPYPAIPNLRIGASRCASAVTIMTPSRLRRISRSSPVAAPASARPAQPAALPAEHSHSASEPPSFTIAVDPVNALMPSHSF